jgi:hypothetical protein
MSANRRTENGFEARRTRQPSSYSGTQENRIKEEVTAGMKQRLGPA